MLCFRKVGGGFAERNYTEQVSFIDKNFFDGLFGMPAINIAIGKIVGIVDRAKGHSGGPG